MTYLKKRILEAAEPFNRGRVRLDAPIRIPLDQFKWIARVTGPSLSKGGWCLEGVLGTRKEYRLKRAGVYDMCLCSGGRRFMVLTREGTFIPVERCSA